MSTFKSKYLNPNIVTLTKMLDSNDWDQWLIETYTAEYQIFAPFLLNKNQEFIEILPEILESIQPQQIRQIKYQTANSKTNHIAWSY